MRKSSLGRRSSTQIPVRVPSLGGGSTTARTCSGKKNTGSLLKPGFSQGRQRRSQSADRESYGGRSTFSMQRANTFGTMTPITPRQSTGVHGGLPTGSARAPRNQLTSTDSNRRLSSFGGTKRKDTRPITEKSFQQAAQAKVQQYFNNYAPDTIGIGNSIRPMNTKLFVDMIDHLLKNLDSRIVITKSNYLEELPQLLKKFGYRSKVDRSWLMTVNTPHSWQHVIAVLSWLVELKESMDLNDPWEMMYPNDVAEGNDENGEEDEDDICIDKEMIFHLKKSYQTRHADEDRLAEIYLAMDDEYLERQIKELKCTDEDFETLQRQLDIIKEELDNELQRKNLLMDEIERLGAKQKAAFDDNQTVQEYIEKSKIFVDTVDVKLRAMEKEITAKKAILEKKKEELKKTEELVNGQQISMDEKEKLNKERVDLQRKINFYENAIREYQNSAFNVELNLAEDQKKLEKIVVEYNKLVAEKVFMEPRLRDVEIKLQFLADADMETLTTVGTNLKMLKEEYKKSISELDSTKEECEDILKRANQDIEKTREEITKGSTMLEGLECDYEKHQELANKETQTLKDDLNRYQKMTKEISEELSQFDPTKLEDKKLKLQMLEHDYDLIQKRSKQFFDGVVDITKEITAQIKPAVKTFVEEIDKFEKDHLQ